MNVINGRRLRLILKQDDEATMAIDFLMTFTLSLFFLISITYAIKDNGIEQAKELSQEEYHRVAGDIAMSAEDMLHAAERNPKLYMEKEIVIHHNVKTIEYIINITNERVFLKSEFEDIRVSKPISNNGNIELKGEVQSSSSLVILIYEPELRTIELQNFR